jgi:hypothetical protein
LALRAFELFQSRVSTQSSCASTARIAGSCARSRHGDSSVQVACAQPSLGASGWHTILYVGTRGGGGLGGGRGGGLGGELGEGAGGSSGGGGGDGLGGGGLGGGRGGELGGALGGGIGPPGRGPGWTNWVRWGRTQTGEWFSLQSIFHSYCPETLYSQCSGTVAQSGPKMDAMSGSSVRLKSSESGHSIVRSEVRKALDLRSSHVCMLAGQRASRVSASVACSSRNSVNFMQYSRPASSRVNADGHFLGSRSHCSMVSCQNWM